MKSCDLISWRVSTDFDDEDSIKRVFFLSLFAIRFAARF